MYIVYILWRTFIVEKQKEENKKSLLILTPQR